MLKQRIVTAIVLAGFLIAALVYLSLIQVAVIFGAVLLLAGWEWSRLAGLLSNATRSAYVVMVLISVVALYVFCGFHATPDSDRIQSVFGVACLWWAIALLWLMGYPNSAQLWGTPFMRIIMGWLVLLPAWLGMVYLLSREGGVYLVLALVIVVAAADIGAYFVGRQWGSHKLAVAISPGKTWEGFFGGLLTSVVCVLAMWSFADLKEFPLTVCLVIGVFTALSSVVGDLVVSMVKRLAQVKDSGSILPGHGGVLDRIDGLTPAAPVFALGMILAGL